MLILLFSLVTFCACSKKSYLEKETDVNVTNDKDSNNSKDKSGNSTSTSSGKCFVQVAGAVNKPGVYELDSDARLFQAIWMAGGLRDDADENSINQAEKISDGLKLIIKTKDEVALEAMSSPNDNKVDINTADAKTLMTLPGIGESKANAIIKYRESKGRFNSCEDLKKITGIKDGVYNKIADSIKV